MHDHQQLQGPQADGSGGKSPLGSAAFVVVCAVVGFVLWRFVAGLLGGPC